MEYINEAVGSRISVFGPNGKKIDFEPKKNLSFFKIRKLENKNGIIRYAGYFNTVQLKVQSSEKVLVGCTLDLVLIHSLI